MLVDAKKKQKNPSQVKLYNSYEPVETGTNKSWPQNRVLVKDHELDPCQDYVKPFT